MSWRVASKPSWATADVKTRVIPWAAAFVSGHSWARSWAVEEDYAGREIAYFTPNGPTGPANAEPFKAHANAPVLRVRITRHKALAPLEIARELPWPPTLDFVEGTLALFTEALRALHKQDL